MVVFGYEIKRFLINEYLTELWLIVSNSPDRWIGIGLILYRLYFDSLQSNCKLRADTAILFVHSKDASKTLAYEFTDIDKDI